ncbi:dopamine receptor 2 isoform X1 [Ptiloglossa arizonensis]|uniref:dopamine receptor 2 isoform X1 n=1 Tax=Ptiloglossa arizonensis TaxID=3350558 RepID=UPI003FA1930F
MNESAVYLLGSEEEAIVPSKQLNRSFYSASYPPQNTGYDDLWNLATDRAGLAIILFVFSVATVFGNVLVILAVVRERYLHTATNYFITSLAFADCLVGLVVMPFSAIYEVLENRWLFAHDWCDVWRSLDVLFSTASILNLCMISLDRYWAVTDPFTYPRKMTRRRAAILIAIVWICSSMISFPAIAWWRAVRTEEVPEDKCPFTQHLGYLIFSSIISFYMPLFVMVFTYYKIYRAAVIQTRSLKLGTKQVIMASGELELTLRIHRGGGTNTDARHLFRTASSTPEDLQDLEEPLTAIQNNCLTRVPSARINKQHLGKNFSLSRKLAKFAKEKKAAKTLGIVMGVFIVCWLPFFVVNLWSGFCTQCIWQEKIVFGIVTWLGWINSGMNPVIYACWSRDFRSTFPGRTPAARRAASATAASARAATVVSEVDLHLAGCDVTQGPGPGLVERGRFVSGTRDCRPATSSDSTRRNSTETTIEASTRPCRILSSLRDEKWTTKERDARTGTPYRFSPPHPPNVYRSVFYLRRTIQRRNNEDVYRAGHVLDNFYVPIPSTLRGPITSAFTPPPPPPAVSSKSIRSPPRVTELRSYGSTELRIYGATERERNISILVRFLDAFPASKVLAST